MVAEDNYLETSEQGQLLKQLLPSVEKQQEALKTEIELTSHPKTRLRATCILKLIDLFPQLSYHEYRSLIGGLNMLREREAESWEGIIDYFSDLAHDISSERITSLGSSILEIIHLESGERRESGRNESAYLTSQALIDSLLFGFRALYPLGVNILAPSWRPETNGRDSSFMLQESVTIRAASRSSSDRVELVPLSDEYGWEVSSYTKDDPLVAHSSVKLRKQESICLGRGHLRSDQFLGLPTSYAARVDLRVKERTWSRAALLLAVNADGRLFVFDRASRNPILCQSSEQRAFEYTPHVISSQPEGPRGKNTLEAYSFGSVKISYTEDK